MRPFHNILSFVAVSNFFYYPSPSLFHLCKHVRKLTRCFSLSILHLICPMSVNFSKTSFLIMSDRKFICFFLILSLLHFFLVFLNISSLFIYSVHEIPNILLQNLMSVVSVPLFISPAFTAIQVERYYIVVILMDF